MQRTKLLRTRSVIQTQCYYCTLCQHPATGSPSGPCKVEFRDSVSIDSDFSVRLKTPEAQIFTRRKGLAAPLITMQHSFTACTQKQIRRQCNPWVTHNVNGVKTPKIYTLFPLNNNKKVNKHKILEPVSELHDLLYKVVGFAVRRISESLMWKCTFCSYVIFSLRAVM